MKERIQLPAAPQSQRARTAPAIHQVLRPLRSSPYSLDEENNGSSPEDLPSGRYHAETSIKRVMLSLRRIRIANLTYLLEKERRRGVRDLMVKATVVREQPPPPT